MSEKKAEILRELAQAVVAMDEAGAKKAARAALENEVDACEAINEGLAQGMNRVGELFEQGRYFVPEMLLSAEAMDAAIELLRPHLRREVAENKRKAVIGVIRGDIHEIGKNLVRTMLDNSGFEVIDLGKDVPSAKFVDAAGEANADLVCISTLMTTTMHGMQAVVEELKKAGIGARTMIGGGPVSEAFAKSIGADGYAKNAAEAVRTARELFKA
ncbi:MAG: corrinoid protein [Syntrophobacteraceae bacterium]